MNKFYTNRIIRLGSLFEKKIAQQTAPSVDGQIDKLRFDNFDGTDLSLLEAAFSLLSPEEQLRIENYMKQKYPSSSRDESTATKILTDPQIMSTLKPLVDKIRKKWEEWKSNHVDGDKESQQHEAKKEEDQNIEAEKSRTRRPLTELDLTALNFRTTSQLEIERRIKKLVAGKAKGQLSVKLIVNPDLSFDYQINFSGTGMDESLKQRIISGLHLFDGNIKTEISGKLSSQNKYINSVLITALWQGVL